MARSAIPFQKCFLDLALPVCLMDFLCASCFFLLKGKPGEGNPDLGNSHGCPQPTNSKRPAGIDEHVFKFSDRRPPQLLTPPFLCDCNCRHWEYAFPVPHFAIGSTVPIRKPCRPTYLFSNQVTQHLQCVIFVRLLQDQQTSGRIIHPTRKVLDQDRDLSMSNEAPLKGDWDVTMIFTKVRPQ